MGLTRYELLKIRKVKRLDAVIKHRPRREIERSMIRTMTNQLRAEISWDNRRSDTTQVNGRYR